MLVFDDRCSLPWPPSPVRGVLFDLDGTLTRPALDFDAMRREIGVEGLLLEALRKLDAEGQRRALDVIARHERLAAENSELNDGARQLLALLAKANCRTALVTRNSRDSVDIVLARHGLHFEAIITRDDAPIKPSPEPLRLACRMLDVKPDEALWVGDGDIDRQTGLAAGIRTIIVGTDGDQPTGVLYIGTPADLVAILREA